MVQPLNTVLLEIGSRFVLGPGQAPRLPDRRPATIRLA
jgi:hypothetical protein